MAFAPPNNNIQALFDRRLSQDATRTLPISNQTVLDILHFLGNEVIDLNDLPGNNVPLLASDLEGRIWNLCIKTKYGQGYLKSTVRGEWAEYVRAKGLKKGDHVKFFRNLHPEAPAPFLVHCVRA